MEKVSGPMNRKNYDNNDITLDLLHRASVVANTRIRYNDKQLLQMVHEHLVMSGRVAMKIFEDFGGALCKEFIVGQEPVSIVHYTRHGTHINCPIH